jgi:cysteinyl-tRNA synthetase
MNFILDKIKKALCAVLLLVMWQFAPELYALVDYVKTGGDSRVIPRQDQPAGPVGQSYDDISSLPGGLASAASQQLPNINFKLEMARLIEQIHAYGQARRSDFQLIGNNASGLFAASSAYGQQEIATLAKNMEGILLESFFFGWGMRNNAETPPAERAHIRKELSYARQIKKPILNIDYCNSARQVVAAEALNKKEGFISFIASTRDLDRIPLYPIKLPGENASDITLLSQIKNFLVILQPDSFRNKPEFITALQNSNADLLIIDLHFGGSLLSAEDVEKLKVKRNGGRRLVFSYMSIGEAEDYRFYWKENWSRLPPPWIYEENPDWKGNYKVRYWHGEWKNLLFGSPESYLDLILERAFDGAFLDIVDAWVYFEEEIAKNPQ